MRRFNIIWYILILILLPLSILLVSGNAVLRVSATYVYHFNDSQVVSEIGTSIGGSRIADEITGYFNSFSGEEFQVYETNGDYRDPIFEETESLVMAKAKKILGWTLLLGIVGFGASIAVYVYLSSQVGRLPMRRIGFIALLCSIALVVVQGFLIKDPAVRNLLYGRFIGIDLAKSSSIRILLSSPFENTYVIFSSVLAVAIIGVLTYIHSSITAEKRLFS